MKPLMIASVLLLGLAVEASSRSMMVAAPPPVAPGNTAAKPPPPSPKRSAGRTAAPGGNAAQATGQGAKNGIGRFSYVPTEDPASSIYKSVGLGRRRSLLQASVPAGNQQPQSDTPKKPLAGIAARTAKRPEGGQATGRPIKQGARPAVDSISSAKINTRVKP